MPRALHIALLFPVACILSVGASQTEMPLEGVALPSPTTVNAIRALSDIVDSESTALPRNYRSLQVVDPDSSLLALPESVPEEPFVETGTMLLLFEPDVTETQVREYIINNDLVVTQTFPVIGAIQVRTDLDRYLGPQLADGDLNETLLRGLTEAAAAFSEHSIIRSASPNILLHTQGPWQRPTDVAPTPSDVIETNNSAPAEIVDWGIHDIEADGLWSQPGARDGAVLGIMDTGFARHEDLVFLNLAPETAVDDHGNHVAGIACAQHNGLGVRGVIPNCFVRARSADVFFESVQGPVRQRFSVLFAQVLSTLTLFVQSQDDVQTFNVSLGYNWRSNFGINPDLPNVESERIRSLVEGQGAFLYLFLEAANASGKVIFSAAGNDSYGLSAPVGAKYASPFNWAALTARERGIANGVVVEAHDRSGRRADFSNVGGDISCPGVDVRSAVAYGPAGALSESAYGVMSGTSMASPYCAGGQVLLHLTRPSRSSIEVVDCMIASSDVSSSGTPMLRLTEASRNCS